MKRQPKLKYLSDPNSVLKAIEEWNQIGETAFLKKYRRKNSTRYQLLHEGKRYPPKAIVSAAYRHQFGVPLISGFGGGAPTNNKLKELRFNIVRKDTEARSESNLLELLGNQAPHPRNQILYGPPGTGKTWHTVNLSLAIMFKKKIEDVNEDDREEFNNYRFDISDDSPDGSGRIAFTTFHQNYAYEDFIEGIRPTVEDGKVGYEIRDGIFKKLAKTAKENKYQPYVLIIDEINRGNIAKIFGELITLIEDSKRLGAADSKEVILPYSQQSFGVPPNLYIIGTMNTADRSIQILDTALRRRFTFIEMMPETSHPKISTDIEGVNCQEILKYMNRRIFGLLDRERQVGHTYFFGIKTITQLADVFQNRIIPLLQEYFFDDWSKIKVVLGESEFVQEKGIKDQKLDEFRDIETKYHERLRVDDEGWLMPENYRKIYAPKTPESESQ